MCRVSRTRWVRMRPYCTKLQLLSKHKTLNWSAMEVGSVCYSHGDSASQAKLQRCQESTLRQLGFAHVTIDSMTTRRKVAYASMVFKQVVLGEGSGFIRITFPIKAAGPLITTSYRETRTLPTLHPSTATRPHTSQRCSDFFDPVIQWNCLPPCTVAGAQRVQEFKRRVATYYGTLRIRYRTKTK